MEERDKRILLLNNNISFLRTVNCHKSFKESISFKATLGVTSSDSPFIEWHVQFFVYRVACIDGIQKTFVLSRIYEIFSLRKIIIFD